MSYKIIDILEKCKFGANEFLNVGKLLIYNEL